MAAILSNAFPASISPAVKGLLEDFYHLSNAASTHNSHDANEKQLVSLFTEDGIYDFAGKENKGHEAILIFREFLFKNAPHRDHPVLQVFTFGEDDLQLMVLGKVGYNFEDGTSHEREWVGRYEIVKDHDGKLKFKKVQIILNPAHPNEQNM